MSFPSDASPRRSPSWGRPESGSLSGFSLVEAVIAIALLGLALSLGLAALARGPRFLAELEVRQRALRSIEGALEALRSGATPVLPGTYAGDAFLAKGDDIQLTLRIEPTEVAALYRVTVTAEYAVGGEARQVEVPTLTWSP